MASEMGHVFRYLSALKLYGKAYVPCPDGSVIYEGSYGGIWDVWHDDIYELVAEWNRIYISEDNIKKLVKESYLGGSD